MHPTPSWRWGTGRVGNAVGLRAREVPDGLGFGQCEPQDDADGRLGWERVVDVETGNQATRTSNGDGPLYTWVAIGGWERAVHGARMI